MSQKRICDHCDKQIPENENYAEISVKIDNILYKGDNCIECAKKGQGLIDIMKKFIKK